MSLPEMTERPTEAMIREVVFGFYDLVRADPLLAPVFNAAVAADEWPEHLERMCDFWSSVLLRTGRFQGRPMQKHLALPELSDEHFLRWLTLFHATTRRLCPPEVAAQFMDRALKVAQSFRLSIAMRDGRQTWNVQPILEADLAASHTLDPAAQGPR